MESNEYEMDDCELGRCYHRDCALYRIKVKMESPQDREVVRDSEEKLDFG